MKNLITVDFLRSILDYNPNTGEFRWKKRNLGLGWDERYAGKIAGVKDSYGYIIINIWHKPYKAHRLAWLYMTGEWPIKEIDHRNVKHGDNAWSNLREATIAQQRQNRRALSCNTSGYKGVHPYGKRWRAAIWINGNTKILGKFDTKEEAYAAYCEAAIKYHGEFARVA